MPARDLKLMLIATALFLGLAAGVCLGGVHEDVLLLAPVLVLAVPLLGGRYLGEDAIHRLAVAYRARHRRAPAALASRALRRTPRAFLRSGRLIACAHTCRPPPAAVPAACIQA
jgi:hypothetical protein